MCHREISPWCLVNVRKEFFQTLEKRHPASPTTRARTSANRDLRVRPCFEHGADNGVVFARGLRGGAVAGKLGGGEDQAGNARRWIERVAREKSNTCINNKIRESKKEIIQNL